jgi:signal transduction histidine kinase
VGAAVVQKQQRKSDKRFGLLKFRAKIRHTESSGSGLGLSICREIVAAHGGQMWVDQSGSGWTAFIVTLSSPKSETHAEKRSMAEKPR